MEGCWFRGSTCLEARGLGGLILGTSKFESRVCDLPPGGSAKKVKRNFVILRSEATWVCWLVFEEPMGGGWFLGDHGVLAGVKTKHGMRAKIVNTPVGYRSYVLLPLAATVFLHRARSVGFCSRLEADIKRRELPICCLREFMQLIAGPLTARQSVI